MPCLMREHLREFDSGVVLAGGRRQGTGAPASAHNPFCKMALGSVRGFHGSAIVIKPVFNGLAFNPANNGQSLNFIDEFRSAAQPTQIPRAGPCAAENSYKTFGETFTDGRPQPG
jgi:hypothetical protein